MAEATKITLLDGHVAGKPVAVVMDTTTNGDRQVLYSVNNVGVNRETFIAIMKLASVLDEK